MKMVTKKMFINYIDHSYSSHWASWNELNWLKTQTTWNRMKYENVKKWMSKKREEFKNK